MITPENISSPDPSKYVGNLDALLEALNSVQESVYLYDPRNHTSLYSNRSILHILGYTEAEIKALGTAWTKQVVHQDDLIFLTKHLTNLSRLAPGKRSRVTYRAKDAKGEWHVIESAGVVLTGADGRPAQVIGCTRLVENLPSPLEEARIHDHRCANCSKLLGKEKIDHAVVEVKCGRCGEFNDIELQ